MNADSFYSYAGILIFIPWLLLILAPNGRYTQPVAVGAAVILLVAAAFYTYIYLRGGGEGGGSMLSLSGMKNLFRSEEMLLTGWLNYLSFSLLVGVWQTQDARAEKIPHIFVIPGLILTMLAGPSGLLLYVLIRFVRTRKFVVR